MNELTKALEAYSPKSLTEERKQQLESRMATAYPFLRDAACQRYGEPKIKRLRNEFRRKPSILAEGSEAEMAFLDLRAIEAEVISGFIRVGVKLCLSYSSTNSELVGINLQDCLQEAAQAIYDAMYLYRGSTRFVTYAHWAIKNRLTDFVRKARRRRKKIPVGYVDPKELSLLSGQGAQDNWSSVQDILDQAPLTDLERELIEAQIRGDHQYRKMLSQTRISPVTQKPYSRQLLSQIFLDGRDKLKARLQEEAA